MPLWMPYAEKALDLSRPVKKERVSPASRTEGYSNPYLPSRDCTFVSPNSDYVPSAQICLPQLYPAANWKSKTTPSPLQSPKLYDTESLYDDIEYQTFEREAMIAMSGRNGGSLVGNNPRMRRSVQSNQEDDDGYRKQRARNNFAAKQSRDRRKLREVRLALQVTFLRKKLAALRTAVSEPQCPHCRSHCLC
ncbi:thyrotroph embryonic factor-like [Hyposmocoma kahamanoa]|uniref:thyrotroph embryonic factor-like n=1 Tax=Hyposmocoma kahamanoa TaxID=1477025 RepID=UPI000E6DA031|nr:thyrotroph embryonic factor-like [Hyposmocoma kahamanoa]